MAKREEKVVKDLKANYIISTLSRTKRKDYENYVLNAIWNRIKKKIRPVSQQYVKDNKGNHYFIDLYFPSINVGIECDEQHHKNNLDDDKYRERTIYDELQKVSLGADYKAIHIQVYEKNFSQIEEQIDDAVLIINELSKNVNLEMDWAVVLEPELYFKDKTKITTTDPIMFTTSAQATNIVFKNYLNKTYKNMQTFGGGFQLPMIGDGDYMAWFPQLVIEDAKGNAKARAKGWFNFLEEGGNIIKEYKKGISTNKYENKKRITFAKSKDKLSSHIMYRFVGIFTCKHSYNKDDLTIWEYEKISDEFVF